MTFKKRKRFIGKWNSMIDVFISTSSFGQNDAAAIESLRRYDCRVELNRYGRRLQKAESVETLNRLKVAGLIAGTEVLDKEVLEKIPTLRVISRCGVGLDNVDIDYCNERGILIYNTPDAPTDAVAELTVGLILCGIRKISLADRFIRQGNWSPVMGSLLQGKIVGIIGFGRIGKKVAEILRAFKCKIIYYDINVTGEIENCRRVDFPDLLGSADIISVHAPFENGSRPLIGERELQLVKRSAIIVNTSRGGAVDENALIKALEEKKISGACLDVFQTEPYKGPLAENENVVLTCHMGSYARESRSLMEKQSMDNLIDGLRKMGLIAQ